MTGTRISDIANRLKADSERAALALLGKPTYRSRRELRWGRKQGLSLSITGPRRGKWRDYSEGEGGDMLDLAERHFGCRERALEWAAGLVGGEIREGDGFDQQRSVGRRTLSAPSRQVVETEPNDAERTRRTLRLWHEARPLIGSPAETYLLHRCGGIADDIASGDVLRFHPRCGFKLADESTIRLPAMIGLFRDMATGEPVAIHRTAIKPDGSGKAAMPDGSSPKKALGPFAGAATMLSPLEAVEIGLGACEGIETGNSILLTGWRPLWAVGGEQGIKKFPRLAGLDCLTLFADNDGVRYRQNGTVHHPGPDAAKACAERLRAEMEVRIVTPPKVETDWNDVLAPRRAAA